MRAKNTAVAATMPAATLNDQVAPACSTRTAPTSAPPNMERTDVEASRAFGLVPPASEESDASPVNVVVSTDVDMSRTPMLRTAALRVPMPAASRPMAMKRGHPDPTASTEPATTVATARQVASTTMTTSEQVPLRRVPPDQAATGHGAGEEAGQRGEAGRHREPRRAGGGEPDEDHVARHVGREHVPETEEAHRSTKPLTTVRGRGSPPGAAADDRAR